MQGSANFVSVSRANKSTATRHARATALLVMAAMVLPTVLGAVAPAWATGPTGPVVRFIAVYDDFDNMPSDGGFLLQGVSVEYRLLSIPGVVLVGPEGAIASIEADPHLDFTERDGPQEYFLTTATFATNAADVWGDAWWPVASEVQRKDPSPLEVDGDVIDGTGVVVGVIDSGINGLHPDLWYAPAHLNGTMPWEPKLVACINVPEAIAALDQPYCDETVGHGTHVAGIVAGNGWAARNDMAEGVDPQHPPIGAAPGAKLASFGLGAGLFIVNAVEAIDYVAANHATWGIDVVTNSWGGAGACNNVMPGSTVNAISNVLIDAGIPVVFANGNYDLQGNPTWSSPHAINPKPGLIAVANYNDQNTGSRDGAVNGGSSDGCVAAGGAQDLVWTWPDVSAPGSNVLSTASYTGTLIPALDGVFYGTASGTSMAAPHVAGIIALMLQANPDLTPAQVERILIETATPYSDGTSARGVTGTSPHWGSSISNNPIAGFSRPDLCKVTPTDAARAEAGDGTVNAKFPSFTTLATLTDADLYVCRDFKRGRGLVDAYAAVERAIALRDDQQGSPEVTIGEPAANQQVPAAVIDVAGLVDRTGGAANDAPVAGLTADTASGTAPLAVTFTLLGSDADGSIASWSLDFADGSAPVTGTTLPTTAAHTYTADGTYDATLTVTDDGGATGEDVLQVSVGGLPVPDGTVTGSLFIYNLDGVGLGLSNVAAIATGATLGDPVPKYVAGELVSMSARSVVSSDAGVPVSPATPAEFLIYDAEGAIAYGPVPAPGANDPGLTGDCTGCTRYDPADFQIPATFGGRYLLAIKLNVNGATHYVFDSAFGGLKPIDVIGAGQVTAQPALPLQLADLDGRAFSAGDAPIAFGSREDPEAEDPGDDTQGDLAFMDVRKAWVGLETGTTLDIHLQVDDLGAAPPTVNVPTPAGAVRASVNYGIELCLNNNVNTAAADGLFCYRLSAVNSVTGPAFSGGVIQRDGTASCGLGDLVQSGIVDVANDTVSWRLNRAALNVTANSADLAACTATPIVRAGAAPQDGHVLSNLEGSTGFTAGARVIATFAQGGDTSDPGNARPYTFGQADLPLSADAGGPYSGLAGATIGIGATVSGGEGPYDCSWTGPGTIADPGACITTVSFAAPGAYTITLQVQDNAGDTATDTATVNVGGSAGERVELRLDTDVAPRTSVAVSTSQASPEAPWATTLDLTGFAAGPHALTATWVDGDGATLDTHTITITVASVGPEAYVTIDAPGDDPSGAAPVSGTIALDGQAGHVGTLAVPEGANGAGLPLRSGLQGVKATVREGGILAPCPLCAPGPHDPQGDLGSSVTWAIVREETRGLDGAWLDVAGFDGAAYALEAEFGSPMDVWFFVGDLDAQSAATGRNVGPAMPKTGTVPAGSNWAFVYIRAPGAAEAQDLQGFDDTALLSLTPLIVPPSAPQLLTALPGPELVALNWLAPLNSGGEPVSAYKVYRDGALRDTVSGATLAFTDDGLVAGQSYAYEVSAANSAGEGVKAGPVSATPLPDTTVPLAITSPADGATGLAGTATLAGTYGPRGGDVDPPPGGNFANTYYFFLMNLNNQKCSEDLGHGDILIASKLIGHARDVLGVPDANIRFFNENGAPLCRADDPSNYDQLPAEYKAPNNPFDGPARLSPFTASLRQAADAAAASEAAGGAPARIFILQSSHGFWSPQAEHVTGSEMALNGETVRDRQFGDAITAALDDAEAGTTADIEAAILVDCSFCGGFADSPLWMPGTTTTAVDSAKVVGPNRVVEVGCTWITECFGNPAVTYDHMFNECTFQAKADGYGPVLPETGVPHPVPGGTGDVSEDLVVPSSTHHAKDGAITMEEAYWCALDSVKGSLGPLGGSIDPIGVQQMLQLVDQMDGDLFGSDGFVLWDVNQNLDLPNRDPDAPLPPRDDLRPRATATDESGDALTPFGDLLQLDATHNADKVIVDLQVASLAHATLAAEDYVEYLVMVNDAAYGICHDQLGLLVYDYSNGGYMDPADGAVAYDTAAGKIHLELRRAVLAEPTIPAGVWARSRYTNCFNAAVPQEDDRVPDAGTISTGTGIEPPVLGNEVRLRLDGPGASVLTGLATLDPANQAWTFDPPGALAEGTYTATAEHWFNDGTGFARVEGPVDATFTVGTPDTTPPTAPDLFVAGTTSTTASLTWDAATDDVGVTGYRVYRAGAPGVPLQPANLAGSTTGLAFTDTGLAPATDYYYVVVAEDAAGNDGPASNEVLAQTDAPPPIEEKVTLTLDGAFLAELAVDTVNGPDPASWATTLDTTTLANGFHDLRAEYDDGRGSLASDAARFYVSNGISLAIASPQDGDAASQDIAVSGAAAGAPPGAAVQLRASNGGGVVQDWTAAAFDGAAFALAFEGMPFGPLTIDARLRDGPSTLAEDSVAVHVYDNDRIVITRANGQAVADAPLGPFSGAVLVEGTTHLGPEADPRANIPPVAVITEPVLLGSALTASGASSYDADGSIVAWAWDLGDGATRSGASLAYAYPAAGTYTVTLTVTDDNGAVGQTQFGPFTTTDEPPGDLTVDAGDSRFVAIGQPLTLSAAAYGGTAPVRFAWDTDADGFLDRNGQTIQVDTAALGEGAHTFTVAAIDAVGAAGTDAVQAYVYQPITREYTFSDINIVGLPDEQAGASGVDQGNKVYTVDVPAGSSSLDAVLTWTVYAGVIPPGTPGGLAGGPNDYDMYVFGPDGFSISSADFDMPEEVHLVEPAAGTWSFEIRPFAATPDIFTLDVTVAEAPPNPVPKADQVNEVCFESATQTLEASALVATGDAITGAWDLDFDGAFDDATGFTAATSFPQDGAAHLVRFRATTDAGFRSTVFLGVRPSLDCPDAPSVVVVGVSDSGINPYHKDFAGELVPDAKLRAYTTADLEVPLPNDAPVFHKQSGQLLPFTKHPSRYIPGFPADAAALKLTLGGTYNKAQDDPAVWARGHAAIPLGKWFWIPGTKIVAAIDTTDSAAINSAGDVYPIFDEDGHGTASASTAVGNFFGSCPRCLLAFAEGLSGDAMFFGQPWIDFVTVSGGAVGNIGSPGLTDVSNTRDAAERGQTISYAAGNGHENAFVTPEQTYLSDSVGPDWNIRVGAVSLSTNSAVHGTGKPVDWSSYGSGSIAGACPNNYSGNCGHSGTSAATPISTGHLASVLLAAREAMGDTLAGQKTPAQAGGQRQAVAVGQAVAGSPWLGDGVLQRHELWNVAFHCASQFGTSVGFPGSLPRSQVDYVYGGYGIADATMQNCAKARLLLGGALPAKPDADAFFEVDEYVRDTLWGDWDGDGDGNVGGNHNRPDSPALPVPPPPVGVGDVLTDAKLTQLWRDLLGPAATAVPGYAETYFPHHRGGCDATDGGEDYMDMTDRSDDFDGCGVSGTPPILGETVGPSVTWTSEVASAGFEAGAAVTGTLYLDYNHPGAPIVQVVLLADGTEVGRSPELQPVTVSPAFGIGPFVWTAYPLDFVATAPIPAGANLELQLMVTGSDSVFVGYEGGHTSRFTVTGTGGSGNLPSVGIASPGQGAVFDKATTATVSVTGTAADATAVQVAVDDATFTTGLLATTGVASWSATWNLAGTNPGPHTLYARACQGALCSAAASRGVLVEDSLAPPAREGSVEVQAVPAGQPVGPSGWAPASAFDGATGDWSYDWATDGLANGDWDFHARLVAEGNEVARDAFQAFLRNSRPPVMDPVGDQEVVEGNALRFTLQATDQDGDAVTITAEGLPDGARLEGANDHPDFVWLPTYGQQGSYEVTFTASDGGSSDSETVTIVVNDARAALLGDGRGFRLIQGALDAAATGESVVVLPGEHPEAVTMATDGITLCSTDRTVLRPADVQCIDASGDVALAPATGDAVTVTASGVVVRDLTLLAPGTGVVLQGATGATLHGLEILGGATGVRATDGSAHRLDGNVYLGNDVGLRLEGATGVRAEDEHFFLVGTVVHLAAASQPDGNVLTRSCVRDAGTLVSLASGVSGVTFDARANDWGVYTKGAVEAGVQDAGTGNTVLLYPWLAEDCATPLLEPTAAFTRSADPLYAVVDEVQFEDASMVQPGSRPIVTWAWDFGDGATSAEQDPSHVYAAAGTYTVTLTVTDGAELQHTTSQVLDLLTWVGPSAAFTAAPNPTDRLTAVQFTDQSLAGTGTIVSRRLEFGDGAESTTTPVQHTYAELGSYTATLTVRDAKGQSSSTSVDLEVLNLPPGAAFSHSPLDPYDVDTVQFEDASIDLDGTVASWAWAFGDGATSALQHPTHAYTTAGTYAVSLTVTDDDGGAHTATQNVLVAHWFPPEAVLLAAPNPTDRLTAVQFTDQSLAGTGTIVSRLLEFGDGASSASTTTQHTYATLGTFTARLTLTDEKDQVSVTTVPVQVLNLAPLAAGSADRLATDRLTAVQFTDASTDADGTIAAWRWDFGDGATSAAQHPAHTYAALGTFAVSLQVTDNDGGVATVPVASIVVHNLGPDAAAGAPPAETDRLTAVQFTDASTDADGTIAAWRWDFGDGANSTAQHPAHTYAALGTYTVTLTVTDNDGAADVVTVGTIRVVNLAPVPDMAWNPTRPNVLYPVQFTDLSDDLDGDVASWVWEFGDGGRSGLQDPVHVYLNGGFYDVVLTVTDNDGGVSSVTKRLFVCAPGLDVASLVDLEHFHLEFELCLRLGQVAYPL